MMTDFEDLSILGWEIQTPHDCRPREPIQLTLRAQTTGGAPLSGEILAVAPEADHRHPQRLAMEVYEQPDGIFEMRGTLVPTATGDWSVVVRVSSQHSEQRTEQRRVTVTSPNNEPWERGPFAKQVLADYWRRQGGELWVGNLASLQHAAELGFDAALNLAEGMDQLVDKAALNGVDYRYLPFADGGHIALPHEAAIDGTAWLLERLRAGKRTLVNCRAGIGRSGSLAVLAGAAEKPSVEFWEIAAQVKADKDIYVHVDTDLVAANPLFRQAFGGVERPQPNWLDIKRVEMVAPMVGRRVVLATGTSTTAELRVVFEGRGLPYVGLRHDLEGYLREPHAGPPAAVSGPDGERVCTYRCSVGPAVEGRHWLTAFATPLGRAIFDVDAAERHWVGGNVDFDVSGMLIHRPCG